MFTLRTCGALFSTEFYLHSQNGNIAFISYPLCGLTSSARTSSSARQKVHGRLPISDNDFLLAELLLLRHYERKFIEVAV